MRTKAEEAARDAQGSSQSAANQLIAGVASATAMTEATSEAARAQVESIKTEAREAISQAREGTKAQAEAEVQAMKQKYEQEALGHIHHERQLATAATKEVESARIRSNMHLDGETKVQEQRFEQRLREMQQQHEAHQLRQEERMEQLVGQIKHAHGSETQNLANEVQFLKAQIVNDQNLGMAELEVTIERLMG